MGHRAAFRGADPSRKLPYRRRPSAALVASDYALAAATFVFLVTYVLISLRTVRRFPIERPAVAMLGGALMLVLGVLTPAQALLAINLDVIVLLVGMMLLVSGLEVCGFFDLVSSRIAVRAKSQASFLAWLMVATAALSAIVLNDTIALLVTPVVVRSTRALRVNPLPYLVAVAIAANVGRVAGGWCVLCFLPFCATTTARCLIAKVDWSIILFFVGLSIVREGVRVSGLSGAIQGGFTSTVGGQSGGLVWLVGLSALLSNLISNVPAVLLLATVVPRGSTQLWLGLAASSTLAGNATILGAACNVIVVQVASRDGVSVSMKDFVKAGLPVTAATLVLSTVLIALLVPA